MRLDARLDSQTHIYKFRYQLEHELTVVLLLIKNCDAHWKMNFDNSPEPMNITELWLHIILLAFFVTRCYVEVFFIISLHIFQRF